jgi:hypothetical protein
MQIDKSEILLAAVYKSSSYAWIDAAIIKLLSFRLKSILAGYLTADHPFWNNAVQTLQARNVWIYLI